MIDKIKRGLKKRKVKIFLVFLLCSALIWFINNLSQTYIGNASFDLEFVNVPDGYLFEKASKSKVDVKLRAGGFQFLIFNFKNKEVSIDLSELESKGLRFFAPQSTYRRQIEAQLSGSIALLEIDNDTLFFDMLSVTSKKVPVKPQVVLNLSQNYLLDGKLKVTPDSITITGPSEEIDSISGVRTEKLSLPDLTSDFSKDVEVYLSPELENTSYSIYTVNLKGEIVRFSEKIFEISIRTINLPNGMAVRTFPEKVAVLCKAKTKLLKELESSDFQVIADYTTTKNGSKKELDLRLVKKPKGLHSARLQQTKVEYILKKQ